MGNRYSQLLVYIYRYIREFPHQTIRNRYGLTTRQGAPVLTVYHQQLDPYRQLVSLLGYSVEAEPSRQDAGILASSHSRKQIVIVVPPVYLRLALSWLL